MRVVVAPDSFKGSLTARQAADAIAAGVRRAAPDAEVLAVPVADGGEGTATCLADAWGTSLVPVPSTDALGRPCEAAYARSPDGRTAAVELASASGLPAVADVPARAGDADTRGTGTVARAALDAGAEEVLLCVGGSATTDGGTGLLHALGARFLDADGRELPPGGAALAHLARVDDTGLHPRARAARWRIACDVTNPLLGPDGAAAVYGPQKGASPALVAELDAALACLADVLREQYGTDVAELPGAGAAGGTPASLVALLGARLEPGAPLVLGATGLPGHLAGADLVLTGEGSFDAQSLQGKLVSVLATTAHEAGAGPVVVLAGHVGLPAGALAGTPVRAALSIARGPAGLPDLSTDAAPLLADLAEHVVRLVTAGVTP